MTSSMVSGIAQSLPLLPAGNTKISQQEQTGTLSPNAAPVLTKDSTQIPGDTISLSAQSRKFPANVTKKDVEKREADIANNIQESASSMARVLFVYDLKGELSLRYVDSAERLIYQTPSELTLRMEEIASKSDSKLDTKV